MTSIRSSAKLLALAAAIPLALIAAQAVSGQGRRATDPDGDLYVVYGKGKLWNVKCSGRAVIAVRDNPEDRPDWLHNCRKGPGWVMVDGRNLGYDLEGKNTDVLPITRYGEAVQWVKSGARAEGRNNMRLQVRNGKLKGWWVGLKVLREKAESGKPAKAKLVLVKDKKDAAIFHYDEPDEIGR